VGSFVHPSELGKFTALVFVFAFCCFLIGPRGRAKAGWGAYAALTGLIMLLTYTRVVWVAAPFAILIVAVICKRPAIPIILFGGAAAVAARVGDVQKRLSGFSSLDVRQRLWSELVPRVNLGDVPFGFGFGRVQAMVQLATVQAGIPFLNQVHNDYLRVFLETGVVGLVLYVATLLGILAISAHALWWLDMTVLGRRLAASLFGCTIVVLITSVTDNLFQRPAIIWTYWALAGAAMQQIYLARKAKAKAKAPASAPVSPVSA
jgi:O-antigen ligase